MFIYKQRVFLFEMCRFEDQRNQRFDRILVNFRSFNLDDLDSNNLSTLREFDDSFVRDSLNVNDCKIIVWKEYDDELTFEFCDWKSELRDHIDENDYLTILFFHLHHHCLSIRMFWESHMMLCESVNDNNNRKDS